MKFSITIIVVFITVLQLHAQGYIVPNGVMTNFYPGEIDVWNSTGAAQGLSTMTQDTGFQLIPIGKQPPTVYSNIFSNWREGFFS